mgnify:CR=1 FL=1
MVQMRDFDLNALRNSILYNVCQQDLPMKPSTTNTLIHYLEEDFTDLTQKIHLQILLHYTKMDVELLYNRYSTYFDMSPTSKEKKMTKAEFFNEEILSFVSLAREKTGADNTNHNA